MKCLNVVFERMKDNMSKCMTAKSEEQLRSGYFSLESVTKTRWARWAEEWEIKTVQV